MRSFRLAQLLLVLLSLLPLSCEKPQPPLLKIDAREISLKEFRANLGPLGRELAALPAAEQKLLLRQTLARLIDEELIRLEAARRNIEISDEDLQQRINELLGQYTPEEFKEIVQRSGQDSARWHQQLRMGLLRERLMAELVKGRAPLSRQELNQYYLAHQEEYQRPEQLQARQMLIKSRAEAENIRQRLIAGENFADLARQYSLSPDRDQGGSLGLVARGELPPEFEQVLFALKPGDISPVVHSSYGLHLFVVEKHLSAGLLPFESVEDEIRHQQQNQVAAEIFTHWLADKRTQSQVEINWQQLDKLHFDGAQ
jgi:parvulin-like peptidyl-prolyl isomerase